MGTARDVFGIIRFFNDDRLGGIHLPGRLHNDLPIQLDAPIFNHLSGCRPRFRKTTAHEFRINATKLHASLRSS